MNAEAFALRRRLYIIFKGEEGLDYGGVSRYMIFKYIENLLVEREGRKRGRKYYTSDINATLCFISFVRIVTLYSIYNLLPWKLNSSDFQRMVFLIKS